MAKKFNPGDRVISAAFNSYPQCQGLVVEDPAYSPCGDYVCCKGNTGRCGYFTPNDLTKVRDYVADHARRSLRKLGLTKQEAAAFVRNVQELGRVSGQSTFSLSQMSRKAERIDLLHGFYWGLSKEGYPYWEAIYDRLMRGRK